MDREFYAAQRPVTTIFVKPNLVTSREFYSRASPVGSSSMASAAATAMAAPPSRAEVLSLLRSLLRTASKFNDYNVREYVKRRSLDAFGEHKSLSDPSSIASAFSDGKTQLEVAKRRAVVYLLYAPKVKSIMDIKKL